ncbi:hypothetical protein BTVI_29894 [Pitangus sulphuratus]|nr:hypothetical protein BTVI_29894 [Pitangus sulphuratus]
MADGALSPGVNLEAFAQAIAAIQALRSSVTRVFDCLKDGMRNKETLEGREKGFMAAFQESLHSVSRDLGELERLSNLVGKPSENHPLHNSGLLSLDPVQDKTPLYSQLLQAYKWSNKLQYHAGLASGLLNQQSLKRSANQMGVSAKRRPKAQPTTLVLPPQYVDDVISRIDRMFPEMSIQLSRPNGTSAMLLTEGLGILYMAGYLSFPQKNECENQIFCQNKTDELMMNIHLGIYCLGDISLVVVVDGTPGMFQDLLDLHWARSNMGFISVKFPVCCNLAWKKVSFPLAKLDWCDPSVTLGKVLKVIVVMRSLFIDRTIVKGYNENVYTEDGKLDIWSKSNYQVFQKVTDHATTALLHYQLPQMPDVVVRSFMTWLRSYIKLFQAPCQRCGKFLQDGLPPTWRDFRTLEAFHDTCRQ